MKTKYLFGMMLSGAMLAACTADDIDSASVAQKVNPSAPVFTVSLDNGDLQNRADYVTSGEKVTFEADKDLLSLYHGVATTAFSSDDAYTNFKDYQNAIYKADSESDEGKLRFATSSMVLDGLAVMIYPGDTTFTWRKVSKTGAPYVEVPAVQDRETNKKTPYMSEILNIDEWKDTADEDDAEELTSTMAGYGRNYQITLKRAASVWKLPLKYEKKDFGENIPTLIVEEVEIDNTASGSPFTLKIPVTKADDEVEVYINKDEEVNKLWKYSSTLDTDGIPSDGKSTSLITTDLEETETGSLVRLTLLPVAEDFEFEEEGTIVFKTNYGNITLTGTDKWMDNPYKDKAADAKKAGWPFNTDKDIVSVAEYIEYIMGQVNASTQEKSGSFIGEYVGTSLSSPDFALDLSKLDMNGVHVKDDAHLNTLLTVHDALEIKDPVTLILDGRSEGKTFVMERTTWEDVRDRLADEDNTISFAACDNSKEGDYVCDAIVLKSGTTDALVPNLEFVYQGTTTPVKNMVDIHLFGTTWKMESTEAASTSLLMKRVHHVTVLAGSKLSLDETFVNVRNGSTAYPYEIINKGTIDVSGNVRVMVKMTNHGKINIPAGSRLIAHTGGTLVNREAEEWIESVWWDTEGNTGGVIELKGALGITEGKGGKIENYGTINMEGTANRLLITTNADAAAKIAEPFSATNRFGTINIKTKETGVENLSIANATGSDNNTDPTMVQAGFIKDATEDGDAVSDLVNYYVVKGTKSTFGKGNKKYQYVEINNNKTEVKLTDATLNLKALIVKPSMSVFIPNGTAVTIGESNTNKGQLFAKGFVTFAGTLDRTNSSYTGYFGGAITDVNNVIKDR